MMDELDIANTFDQFAAGRGKDPRSATAAFWEFCEDHPVGQPVLGNEALERRIRNILSSRGWGISKNASFLGEDAGLNDCLDVVLENE